MKIFTSLLLLLLALPALAQQRLPDSPPGASHRADPDDRYWESRFGPGNGITGAWYSGVRSIVRSDGSLYVGGDFSHAGDMMVNNIARYDGTAWHPLVSEGRIGVEKAIMALASAGREIYAGGDFDSIGAVATGAVARWDGTSWSRIGAGLHGRVLTLLADGEQLLAGGTFRIGELGATSHVALWNGSEWQPVGGDLNGDVHAIALHNGTIYIGGTFDTVENGIRTGPVAWWAPGSGQWRPSGDELADSLSGVATVRALVSDGDDLYAGGRFDHAGTTPLGNIARLNGSRWESLGEGVSDGSPALVLVIEPSPTEIFVGGTFGKAGGRGAGYIARWDRSARVWKSLGSGVTQCEGFECNTAVSTLLYDGEGVWAGGNFMVAGEKPSQMIGRWSTTTSSAVEPVHQQSRTGLALAPSPFAGSATISFTLSGRAPVRLGITDASGRQLAILVDGTLAAGKHRIIWDAARYPAGLYLCTLDIDGVTTTEKIVKSE